MVRRGRPPRAEGVVEGPDTSVAPVIEAREEEGDEHSGEAASTLEQVGSRVSVDDEPSPADDGSSANAAETSAWQELVVAVRKLQKATVKKNETGITQLDSGLSIRDELYRLKEMRKALERQFHSDHDGLNPATSSTLNKMKEEMETILAQISE
ncbi:unnamed protein product [Amoebophrya sp. A25]|nr:unnamed protein product [Amoebophrya sp. A25]|eukprot:GSA25T00005155001.1